MLMISNRLKILRTEKKLKQAQVAEIVGVNKSAISAYENGLRQPSYDVLIRLANLYCVTTDYLLGRKNLKSLDVSGLSDRELALVTELIKELTDGNRSDQSSDLF